MVHHSRAEVSRKTRAPGLRITTLALCLTALGLLAQAPGRAQTIAPERTFIAAWHDAGVRDGFPFRRGVAVTDFGAVGDGVQDDTAAVLQAIDWVAASPAVGMVYFPAGDYRITATLHLPAEITLRGERDASGNRARLLFDFGGADGDCIRVAGSPAGPYQSVQPAPVHATAIVVSDASEFAVGDHAEIRQENDPAWDNGDTWAQRAEGQILRIVGIEGNTLYLEQALRAEYQAQFDPQIRRVALKQHVGIDNLDILRIDAGTPIYGDHIHFSFAADCWVRGVEFENCVQRFVNIHSSSNIEVSGCVLHHAFAYGGGGHAYGVECSAQTGQCLVENNIFYHLRHSMLLQNGGNGNVFAYNFSTDPYWDEWPHDSAAEITFHGNRPFANLFEGNIVDNIYFDGSHGQPGGPYNTVFRNSAAAYGLLMLYDNQGQNIVGNDILDGLIGMYLMVGSDHFEWGNREDRLIFPGYNVLPPGTDSLPDYSYYLSLDPLEPTAPNFWDIPETWPTIGSGSTTPFGEPVNPAQQRYLGPGPYTVGPEDPVELVAWCPGPLGDIDDDGRLSTSDALLAYLIALGEHQPSELEACRADADQDGRITTTDSLCIFLEVLLLPHDCYVR
jgi:hypothetical protein